MKAQPFDVLRALILILHAKTARDGFPVQYAKGNEMTPNLKGLPNALQKLQQTLDVSAAGLIARMDAAGPRAAVAIAKANTAVAQTEASITAIETFVAGLEQTNGGPTLGDSASQSAAPTPLKL